MSCNCLFYILVKLNYLHFNVAFLASRGRVVSDCGPALRPGRGIQVRRDGEFWRITLAFKDYWGVEVVLCDLQSEAGR